MKMIMKKIWVFAAILTLFIWLATLNPVMAGMEGPPEGAAIVGPEVWGVVVVDCTSEPYTATLRVKRVVDCNPEMEARAGVVPNCPANESAALGIDLTQLGITSLFGIPNPVITKVKNFASNGTVSSFDVQIKFWEPSP